MNKSSYLALALLAPAAAHAQQVPSAGTQLQQLPQPPVVQKPAPELDIAPRPAPVAAPEAGPSVRVDTLHITGRTAYGEAELLRASGFVPGGDFTLSQLRALAVRISDYYHRRGYILAQAYLPAQDVQGGVVTIDVIEGRYGAVAVHNKARIADRVPEGILRGLDPGDLVANAPLERRLLLPFLSTNDDLYPRLPGRLPFCPSQIEPDFPRLRVRLLASHSSLAQRVDIKAEPASNIEEGVRAAQHLVRSDAEGRIR